MRVILLWILIGCPACLFSQSQSTAKLCDQLDRLVKEDIPEGFEGRDFELTSITEVDDPKIYKKYPYNFMDAAHIYFSDEGENNNRVLCYPLMTVKKEEAVNFYLGLKQALDQCKLVYTSFAENPNPNLGVLAVHTIGIDRRFYNSKMSLHQYVSDSIARYWIEYEIIAPKQSED